MVNFEYDSDTGILTYTASGKVKSDEIDRVISQAEVVLHSDKKKKALIRIGNLEGYEPVAFFKDLKFTTENRSKFEKAAVIGRADWQKLMAAAGDKIINGEVRYFDTQKEEEARRWLLQ